MKASTALYEILHKTDFLAWYVSVCTATYLAMLRFNKGLCTLGLLFGKLGGIGVCLYCMKYLTATVKTHLRKLLWLRKGLHGG